MFHRIVIGIIDDSRMSSVIVSIIRFSSLTDFCALETERLLDLGIGRASFAVELNRLVDYF